jgi:hypothetical protein
MLLFAAVIAFVGPRENAGRADTSIDGSAVEMMDVIADFPSGSDRPNYLHSVIAGGAYEGFELAGAMRRDAVVANHYRGLTPDTVRREIVTKDRMVYVSYRKDDRIYWTRNKVLLRKGETILTDGATEIRARCGNCISDTPRLPVAEAEPDPAEFDRLIDNREPSNPIAAVAELSAPAGSGPSGVTSSSRGEPAGGTLAGPTPGANGSVSGGAGGIAPSQPSHGQSFGSTSGGTISNPGSDVPSFVPTPGGPGFPPGRTGPPAESLPPYASPTPVGPPFETGPSPISFPPGLIDPPPGLDSHFDPDVPGLPSDPDPPEIGSQPPDGGPGPDSPGHEETPLDPTTPVSVPEPGMLLLIGGGAALAMFRKLRSRR